MFQANGTLLPITLNERKSPPPRLRLFDQPAQLLQPSVLIFFAAAAARSPAILSNSARLS